MIENIVIVGGGQAGYVAAKALREGGYDGALFIVADEAHPPYERPPLSKAVLLGESPPESTYLTSRAALAELDIVLVHDRAERIDRQSRAVVLANGRRLDYDALILATGGSARALTIPGSEQPQVHTLRNLDDAIKIRQSLEGADDVVVIGGGWIGLEVASSARKLGAAVTVIELADRLCGRVLDPVGASLLLELHQRHGVTCLLDEGVAAIAGNGRVSAVELRSGEVISANVVIVGVGLVPNIGLAAAAGLATATGILVDENCRTHDPSVFAIGDVAEVVTANGKMRCESWANANEQGALVAAVVLGAEPHSRQPPWFWSDQYGVNIQILGTIPDNVEPVILGDPGTGKMTLCYVVANHLCAIIAFDRPRDIQAGRRIMQRKIPVTRDQLACPGADLVQILNGARREA